MKLTDFVNQYNGKYLSVLNPGKQCYDVPVKWSDLLGIPHFPNNPSPFPYVNAHEIYTRYGTFQQQHFDRIANSIENKPQEGDIVVWAGSYNGGIGHVAVATGVGNYSSFEAFSQNDPTGSVCIKRMYNYNHVLGWLRPKNYITNSPTPMDRRPYWFDLLNKVIWNKPKEQITDKDVTDFTAEYPNQREGNGKWSQLLSFIFQGNVDSNKVTVAQATSKIVELQGGFTQKDLDNAHEKGRRLGINQVISAAQKL